MFDRHYPAGPLEKEEAPGRDREIIEMRKGNGGLTIAREH